MKISDYTSISQQRYDLSLDEGAVGEEKEEESGKAGESESAKFPQATGQMELRPTQWSQHDPATPTFNAEAEPHRKSEAAAGMKPI